MFCNKCGAEIESNSKVCPFCNESNHEYYLPNSELSKPKKNNIFVRYKFLFVLFIVLIICLISFALFLNKRAKVLVNIEKNSYVKFKLGEKELYLGDKVFEYKLNGLTYEDQYIDKYDYVESDSINMYNFYNEENKLQFLGVFYCAKNTKCTYDESVLIKINFSKDSDVVVDDYIKYGVKYNEIIEKYGKEDGKYYQDENYLVWTFGKKGQIGTPYYILKFDNDGWSSTGGLSEIRIGTWWYEGEYEHTVIKDSEEVVNEK